MRILSSSALWWLLLGAIIILFYFMKLRRKRAVVPSVIFWQRALEELEANAPFKKLRRSLLLLLQLLALTAVVLALARPLVVTRALASGSTIIVIDSTASMSSRDEEAGSRLDRAKQLARQMIAGLGGGDRAAVIESSARVTVRSSLTSDAGALASAIDDIQHTDAPGNLTDAVRLANQIARSERDANIVIISDGGSPIDVEVDSTLQRSVPPREAPLRFVRVGRRSENVGVIALNSRQISGSTRREMFASIANFGETILSVGAELKIDAKVIDARTIDIAPGDRRALVFDTLPEDGGLAELKLDAQDDLASDNVAYSFVAGSRRARVGVIGDNPFLLQALAANTNVDARKVAQDSTTSQFDCLIAEGASSRETLGTNRSVLLINPPDATGLFRTAGVLDHPEISSVEGAHPVNAYLSYRDLHVESAPRREVASWLKPIASAGVDPLIWAGDDGRRRVVVIGFDLAKSDLPLKVEFPILLANSLSWLAGEESPSDQRVIRPGQPAIIQTSARDATVTTPSGESSQVGAHDGKIVFADTMRVGRYEVTDSAGFAASLVSEAESNTTPRDSIRTQAGEVKGQVETFQSEREVWRWVALLALLVLSVEWWVYHKRIS